MKKYTGKRRGDQTGFALPATPVLPIFFIKSSLIRMKDCKSCQLVPSFIKTLLSFIGFMATLKLGMK
jgi:hypothetical protein